MAIYIWLDIEAGLKKAFSKKKRQLLPLFLNTATQHPALLFPNYDYYYSSEVWCMLNITI